MAAFFNVFLLSRFTLALLLPGVRPACHAVLLPQSQVYPPEGVFRVLPFRLLIPAALIQFLSYLSLY